MVLKIAKRTLIALFCFGLAAHAYIGNFYILNRDTNPDVTHTVSFAAHGEPVYVSPSEDRNYWLLWYATLFVGLLGGVASVADERRAKRKEGSQ